MILNKDNLTRALNELFPETKPLWGKMSAQHMVEHLALTFRISNGTLSLDSPQDERRIKIQKRFLLSGKPLPKLFINPVIGADLLPLESKNFKTAKSVLLYEYDNYQDYFAANPASKQVHPVFGSLNKSEWDVFHKKHLEHHFSQFGIKFSVE